MNWEEQELPVVELLHSSGKTTFRVGGVPVTQGSKTGYVVNGRAVVVDQNHRALRDWRHAINDEARRHWAGPPLQGPVSLSLEFWLQKPQAAPKRKRTWPIKARSGDLDKQARAALDALTGIVFADDSQVVSLFVTKDWAPDGQGPGVEVTIWEVP